jgi:hypothetical protein
MSELCSSSEPAMSDPRGADLVSKWVDPLGLIVRNLFHRLFHLIPFYRWYVPHRLKM